MQRLSPTESDRIADGLKRFGEYTKGAEYTIEAGREIKIYELEKGAWVSGRLIGDVRAKCEVSEYEFFEFRSSEPFRVDIESKTYSFPVARSFKIVKRP